MNTELDTETIQYLSKLSRIEIAESESETYAQQLGGVVSYVDQLKEVHAATKQKSSEIQFFNQFAEDHLRKENDRLNMSREELLSGAPVHEGNFIVVRAVLNED